MCTVCKNTEFVRERDGSDKAVEYVTRAVTSYRRAVLKTRGLVFRRVYIEAYLAAKRVAIAGVRA